MTPERSPAEQRWLDFEAGRRCIFPVMPLGLIGLFDAGYATYRKEGTIVEVFATPIARRILASIALPRRSGGRDSAPERARAAYAFMEHCFRDEEHIRSMRYWQEFLRLYGGS